MARNVRGRPIGLVLLALGPLLVAAYAVVNHAAIRTAVRAQITAPGWEGRVDADGMTAVGVDTWRLIWWLTLAVELLAVAFGVIGVLLRRSGRGRTFLLVLSGVLIVPYAAASLVAFVNPVRLLAELYNADGFVDGLPSWLSGTALILVAAGLAQAVGLASAAGASRRPPVAADQERA
ncbi:hypothetical protein [Nonomuraea jiangxiensis]|uniref:Uncharacterized protein n=1 Tax=Nonomuraea jiangxiensis TaxID=633440 RepID=A0A1G8H9X0_9ACTN|nr:hypothetical protein [Nonomuraea jiangxiensis]SDI03379.1 hypothetical protein SAMN05421869_104103 [Nonomuraea jiangxiensis]